MKTEMVSVDKVIPYARNPRNNETAITKVAASIQEFGFRQPIVVDKNMVIVVGDTRVKAAKKLGMTHVPIHVATNLTEQQCKAYRIADNKTNEDATWDNELLGLELSEIDDLFTGFSPEETDWLTLDSKPDQDDIPELPEQTFVQQGDIFILGNHKLICGDSTKEDTYKLLFADDKVKCKLVFTSPPYNMGRDFLYGKGKDNKVSSSYINFNLGVMRLCGKYTKGLFFWNMSYNKKTRWEFIEIVYKMIKELDMNFMELITWHKKHAIPIGKSTNMLTRMTEQIYVLDNEDDEDIEHFGLVNNDERVVFNKTTALRFSSKFEAKRRTSLGEPSFASRRLAFELTSCELHFSIQKLAK